MTQQENSIHRVPTGWGLHYHFIRYLINCGLFILAHRKDLAGMEVELEFLGVRNHCRDLSKEEIWPDFYFLER